VKRRRLQVTILASTDGKSDLRDPMNSQLFEWTQATMSKA
jgi:hypothetical protein